MVDDHRADVAELRRVMHGYGVGLGSFLTRCLVVDRELPALRVSAWAFANLMQRAWSSPPGLQLTGGAGRSRDGPRRHPGAGGLATVSTRAA